MRVSIVGLGKLGCSMAAAFASRGVDVVGYDIDQEKMQLVRAGLAPVAETDLQRYLDLYRSRITAASDPDELLECSDMVFIVVPTPSAAHGGFSTVFVENVVEFLADSLRKSSDYQMFVLTSTVLPGETRRALVKGLQEATGKVAGEDFGVCYSPEFIALGSVISDLLNPDFILIGQLDERSGDLLEELTKTVTGLTSEKIQRMSIESAEVAKISINGYVTLKISYANMLALMCHKTNGASIDDVTTALGLDSRIGPKYLKGGGGYGGPCFPRDNLALGFYGKLVGADTSIPLANHNFNALYAERMFEALGFDISNVSSIGIIGYSYKKGSGVTTESFGSKILSQIVREVSSDCRIFIFDEDVLELEEPITTDSRVQRVDELSDMGNCDLVFLVKENFDRLEELIMLLADTRVRICVDIWRQINPTQVEKGCAGELIHLGLDGSQ